MRLVGYDLPGQEVRPGEQFELTLYWEILAPMERDWSVFVHLNDPVIHAPVAQRDMYPGQGLLATRLLEPGQGSGLMTPRRPGGEARPGCTQRVLIELRRPFAQRL